RTPAIRRRHRDLLAPHRVERDLDLRGRLGGREEQDRAASIHGSEALDDRLRAPVHVITYFARRPSLSSRTFAGTSSRPSMTTSAPAFRAAAFRYSTMSVAITFAAPDAFASFTWRSPATPLPITTTV